MLNKLKPKSKFSRNVLTLMTGTTVAQIIPIVISPILTRIYTPEDFGVFALYISLVSFIAIVATARYEMAIVLPKSEKEAINLLALSVFITFCIVFIITLIIIIFGETILNTLNADALGNILYLVPLSIFLAGLAQSFNYWSNRKEYFKNISNAQISQSISIGVSQPLFKYMGINSGLILGNILGRFVSVFVLIDKFIKNDRTLLHHVNKEVMIEQMIKYKDFPLVNSLHAFSDILRSSGSVLLVSSFFGTAVLGFYALSLRVLQIPIGIIGSALGQVLYKKFTLLYNENKNIYAYARGVVIKLFFIAVPLFGILFFIAPDLFSFVFGEKWRLAGEYSRLFIPYLFMNFLISPISHIPIVLGKQKEIFYISLFGNVLFLLMIVATSSLKAEEMLIAVSSTQFIFYCYVGYWYYKILQKVNYYE